MMKRKIRLMFLSIAVSTCIGMLPIYETMSQKVHAIQLNVKIVRVMNMSYMNMLWVTY